MKTKVELKQEGKSIFYAVINPPTADQVPIILWGKDPKDVERKLIHLVKKHKPGI